MELESRQLRYFVAVAEELHFGRAAQRLGIAQPPLSRAVRALERQLGSELFVRGSRGVSLTAAGAVLLDEGRRALAAIEAAGRRARRAAAPTPCLVLALKPSGSSDLLRRILARHAGEPGAAEVDVVVCRIGEQAAMLRDGRADLALLRLPWDDVRGFDVEVLRRESNVAVLPAGHRLAARPALRLEELAGEPQPRWPGEPEDSRPLVHDHGQLLELVALGRAVAVLPASVAEQLRPDLAAVPVLDAPPTTLALAWPEHSRRLAVARFVRAAAEVAEPIGEHVTAVTAAP